MSYTYLTVSRSVMATGGELGEVCIWTTKTKECECIGILKGHEGYLTAITIEDNYVITGSSDKTIRKWDMSTCGCEHVYRGHNSIIQRLLCTGDFIFSGSYDRTARCWDIDSGECIRVFTGHTLGVTPLIFIPEDEMLVEQHNQNILITGSADYTARTWSFETGKTLRCFKGT